ncbi:MAG: aldo/keto reductase [Oscillospiraceae bacterium]|nr:aldo/keto reductase [Oscillospiraceae bacterium]
MRHIKLKDMEPSFIGIGVSGFGIRTSDAESEAILDEFIGLGGNVVDTANVYCNWDPKAPERACSEKSLGRIFKKRPSLRDRLIVCTKGAHFEPQDKASTPRVNEGCIKYDLEDSVRNLGIDVIDVYFLHRDNPTYPVWLIMDALFEAQDAGTVRILGASNWSAARIAEANAYARSVGREGFAVSQIMHSYMHPLVRDAHASRYFDEAEEGGTYLSEGLTMFAYTSVAKGFMTKALAGRPMVAHLARLYECATNRERAARAAEVARQVGGGRSVEQIGLAYLRSLPYKVTALVSFSDISQLRECCDCDFDLAPGQAAFLAKDETPLARVPLADG